MDTLKNFLKTLAWVLFWLTLVYVSLPKLLVAKEIISSYFETNIAPFLISTGGHFLSVVCLLISLYLFLLADRTPKNQALSAAFFTLFLGSSYFFLISAILFP